MELWCLIADMRETSLRNISGWEVECYDSGVDVGQMLCHYMRRLLNFSIWWVGCCCSEEEEKETKLSTIYLGVPGC